MSISTAAAALPSTPTDAPYTRFELTSVVKGDGHTQSFAVYDDAQYPVDVITTTFSRRSKYPFTQVALVTREEAREIWARSVKQGLKPAKPFRQKRFGPVPAKAA